MPARFFFGLYLALTFTLAGCSHLKKPPAEEPTRPLAIELEIPRADILLSDAVAMQLVFRNTSEAPLTLPVGMLYPDRNIFVRGYRSVEKDPFVPLSAKKYLTNSAPAVTTTNETFTLAPGASYKIVLSQLKWFSILDDPADTNERGDWYVRALYTPPGDAGAGVLSPRLMVRVVGKD